MTKQLFKKGDARINRKGRPKGAKNISTLLKAGLQIKLKHQNLQGKEKSMTMSEILVINLLSKVKDGDLHAIRECLDRLEGKPITKGLSVNASTDLTSIQALLGSAVKVLDKGSEDVNT